MLGAAAVLAAAAVPATADGRADDVNRTILDTCARVFDGRLSLADHAQVSAEGWTATAPRQTENGTVPRAERRTGAAKVVIAGRSVPGPHQCAVWFGGPDNTAIRKAFLKTAKAAGFAKGPTMRLGDGHPLYLLVRAMPPQTLTVIEADAGGEYGAEPATTVIYMDKN